MCKYLWMQVLIFVSICCASSDLVWLYCVVPTILWEHSCDSYISVVTFTFICKNLTFLAFAICTVTHTWSTSPASCFFLSPELATAAVHLLSVGLPLRFVAEHFIYDLSVFFCSHIYFLDGILVVYVVLVAFLLQQSKWINFSRMNYYHSISTAFIYSLLCWYYCTVF